MTKSVRVVNVLDVKGTVCVAKTGEATVPRDIKTEAVARDSGKILDSLSRLVVEALGADLSVAAASHDEVLAGDEADGVDDRVQYVAVVGNVPDHLRQWSVESAEVPDLDAFAECATTCHHIVVTVADVDAVTRDCGLTPDGHVQSVGPDVPEANLSVPTAGNEHIRRFGVEAASEDLTRVCRFNAISDLLHPLHTLLVINFNVRLGSGDAEAA